MPEKVVDKVDFRQAFEFPKKPEPKNLKQWFYDTRTNEYMGRYLFLFYGVYFIVLGALTTACFQSLFMVLSDDAPYFQLSESLIGTNPGLGYRPLPEEPEDSGFIHYVASNKTEIDYWVGRLNHFTEPYRNTSLLPGGGRNHVQCDFNQRPKNRNVCAVDLSKLGPCTAENGYSYHESSPCILIKLNRIYGWVPEYYDDPENLPENMPQELKEYIGNRTTDMERKQIWITCNGVNPADNEAIGPISYYPSFGIPSYYFPFTNQPDYLSPLLAVQFQRPALQRSIYVECRAWAKNIRYRGGSRDRQGSTQFSILIDYFQ
ncbi:sodium/potassium-dependent ATPase beta-2 subunit [Culex quinquefasciatus]|uniref:Sodium/potassium-dependent ATPase beta-2 subunit n=2 Tax=Culex quinquefasciatus TaxID=7176 RepID=B0WIC4_CULQU|nr:sodium/potassium-dependent ATPase beta-2 subunit [Culex quinquefasciatus]|eukprot:XP_001848458.1 sodium/potassium-dependent ATPase beta-2 subunit [Culex quinquefasciatus]